MKTGHKLIVKKANQANLGDVPVTRFMRTDSPMLKSDYTIKSTIDTFRIHHISSAVVTDFQDKIVGVISEYDLLIQAASRRLSDHIVYQSKIISVSPKATLKEVLVVFYKQKLKWLPIVNDEGFVQGAVSRIDMLNFIATHCLND